MIDAVDNRHIQLLSNSKTELSTAIKDANDEYTSTASIDHIAVLTQIHAIWGGPGIYLYINLPTPLEETKQKKLYSGYMKICVNIAKRGNEFANKLVELYKEQKKEIPEDHLECITMCRNNFVFYISSENDKDLYADHKANEKEIADARSYIIELEKMADKSKFKNDIRDTIIWARLVFGIITAKETKERLEVLLKDVVSAAKDKNIAVQWRKQLIERYEFYDRFPEHKEHQVQLGS